MSSVLVGVAAAEETDFGVDEGVARDFARSGGGLSVPNKSLIFSISPTGCMKRTCSPCQSLTAPLYNIVL